MNNMEEEEEDFNGLITSLNICCFGVNNIGVPVAAVFADKCPFYNISVVDLDPDKITSWNTKQINMHEEGLEKILRKCENKNLVFTNDLKKVIKVADVFFLCLNTMKKQGGFMMDISEVRNATELIAEFSEHSKIVVVKNKVPLGTCELVKEVLSANGKDNVRFQVLSVPVFLSPGNAVSSLSNPDRVLIGSDLSKGGLKAAEIMSTIYSYWVPKDRIITMTTWSAEMSRLTLNAFVAQRMTCLQSLGVLCEEYAGDLTEVTNGMKKLSKDEEDYEETSLCWGGPHLKNDINYLIYMCSHLKLAETAAYWKEVLKLNEYHKLRSIRKITSTFFNVLTNERMSLWGLGFEKNVEMLEGSPGVEICLLLLEEGVKLNVFDTIEKGLAMEGINKAARKAGMDPSLLKDLCYYEDPYKAAHKTSAIIICNKMEEFKDLKFDLIFKYMVKPSVIFDGQKCLPREELIKIGFSVQTICVKFL